MEIFYSEKSVKQLKKITQGDSKSGLMIINKIEEYAENPKGNFDIKLLKGKYADFKRLRVGNFRVIFDEENNIMMIYEIKHRKEAYE